MPTKISNIYGFVTTGVDFDSDPNRIEGTI